MVSTFTCYLHKPDSATPELRVVACEEAQLVHQVMSEMRNWGRINRVEVYDAAEQSFRFALTPPSAR